MSQSGTKGLSVAIFGAMSVLAREIRRSLEEGPVPVEKVRLYEKSVHEGSLTEFEGEPMVVTAPDPDSVGNTDLSIICGEDDPLAAKYLDWIRDGKGKGIDLIGAARHRPEIPTVNCDVNPEAVTDRTRIVSSPQAMAHPLSTVLHALEEAFGLDDACATVFRPVSDLGRRGVEELHHQTISVLNFEDAPRKVFGRQLAFNLLPMSVHGEEGRALEQIVREDVGRVLGMKELPLSLRIIQAPVFYTHSYMMRVRLQGGPDQADLVEALRGREPIHLAEGEEQRTPAELAEEPGIHIAEISPDGARDGGFWMWMISDGLRSGIVANAARLAARLAGLEAR